MKAAKQLNQSEPSASAENQNNWNCKCQLLQDTAELAGVSAVCWWAGSFPNPCLFLTCSNPPQQDDQGPELLIPSFLRQSCNLKWKLGRGEHITEVQGAGSHIHIAGSEQGPVRPTPQARDLPELYHMKPITPQELPKGLLSTRHLLTFGWRRWQPQHSQLGQTRGFHTKFSSSSQSALGRAGGGNWGFWGEKRLLTSSWHIFVPHICRKPAKKDCSLEPGPNSCLHRAELGRRALLRAPAPPQAPGQACTAPTPPHSLCVGFPQMKTYQHTLFIRARLGNLSVADLGGRVETFDIYVFCPLTTNKVPPTPLPLGTAALWKHRWTSLFMVL